jgi:beta-xylosidase
MAAGTPPGDGHAAQAAAGAVAVGRKAPAQAGPAAGTGAWRDPASPVAERVRDLLSRMTLAEKLAQMTGVWLAVPDDAGEVAPLQGDLTDGLPPFEDLIRNGLGQLTRVFGTRPVSPADGAAALTALQRQIAGSSRFGVPAIAHEECLTGFTTWRATAFPTPLAWGASFDPALVEEMAAAIGASMRAAGVHQGLAPVLDVARDPRWGRVEETIGADPHLVGVIGTAYVRGLQSAGVIATLKHFAGYSGSREGRNMAPVSVGRREFTDVFLAPFEMAIRIGHAGAVMHSYTDVDGVPAAADRDLLTRVLREELGFDGVVVADYYGISFLETLHGVAGSPAQAGALALAAGVDVELPNVRCYGQPLLAAAEAGQVPEELIDRAAARVLRQKCELGLLDTPATANGGPADLDFDPPAHRDLARRLAEESVVLLANARAALPLGPAAKLAVVGPLADDPMAFFGCYTFPRHVGQHHPGAGLGISVSTVLEALRRELPHATVGYERGCDVRSGDRSRIAAAVACARGADAVVAVLGDEAGLFGRGSSGEGCDAGDLSLPGVQPELLAELAAAGKPVIAVLVTGRPYSLGQLAGQLGAVVQAFFPGEEGGTALAGVLSGRVVPSGKLPMEIPSSPSVPLPAYLQPPLAGRSDVSSVDPTPLFAFGHGLSYTTFDYGDLSVTPGAPADGEQPPPRAASGAQIPTDGCATIALTVRNAGTRAGTEVVQLYLRDPVAQVVRPSLYLAGFARVALEPGQARRVAFRLHADRTAFCGLSGARVVEPGLIEVAAGSSSADLRLHGTLELTGAVRTAGPDRVLTTPVAIWDA